MDDRHLDRKLRDMDRKLRHLPARPGVYLFKGADGRIIYIGKAKSLRARVRSHFAQEAGASVKNQRMLALVADIDTIVVGSEAEALLLEANLIKEHRPRFNIQLRDDKKYPYIKVTVQEPFPRVFVTRLLENDGARYFGPYTEVGAMRHALEVVKRLYTVRTCRYDLPGERPDRPCLDYHIGRCRAPCVGLQDMGEYRAMVDELMEVLSGRIERVRRRVEREMREAAGGMEFERAASLRDALGSLSALERRQRALDVRGGDQDVLGTARDGDRACAVLLRIRDGKLLGRDMDYFENLVDEPDPAIVGAAFSRFYFGRGAHGTLDLPSEVLLPLELEERDAAEALLTEHAARRVRVHTPVRGEKRRLLELASQNARHLLEERTVVDAAAEARADDALYELQEALELKVVPRLIVCFDISHSHGTDVVGSAVVFRNGEPAKDEYRRFKVRGEWGNDDYRSMSEVVGRYFRRRLEEGSPLPELALVDGGRGQLSTARETIARADARDTFVRALAKREEAVYLEGRQEPVRLPRSSPALRLLQRIRDEAHRFANSYNRNLRRRRTLASELADVPGVGPARQEALLRRFGSTRALRRARAEEIAELPGFSRALASRIVEHLGGERSA